MAFVESVVESLNTRIDFSLGNHLCDVYYTLFLLIQAATSGFYVGIENNTRMVPPILYKAGYPWLGPRGIIDGCVTIWNVCVLGIGVFTDFGGRKSPALVKFSVVLVIGYATGGILAYYTITDIDNCLQWVPTLFTVQNHSLFPPCCRE